MFGSQDKKALIVDIIQVIVSIITLVLAGLAYVNYAYQSKYEAFTEYASVLNASTSVVQSKLDNHTSDQIFKSVCKWTSQEDEGKCNDSMSKLYSFIGEKVAEIDTKFGKLDGLFYLNKVWDREKIEKDYVEIKCDLTLLLNTMTEQAIDADRAFVNYNTWTIANLMKLNKKVDKHLIGISNSVDPFHFFGKYAEFNINDVIFPVCRR